MTIEAWMRYKPYVRRPAPEKPSQFFDGLTASEVNIMVAVMTRYKEMSPEAQGMIMALADMVIDANNQEQPQPPSVETGVTELSVNHDYL
jgi:hypothetical protein